MSKILDRKDKGKTMRKLSCLKELLDISPDQNQAIVISDSDEDVNNNEPSSPLIKQEHETESKSYRNRKRKKGNDYSSDSDADISKVKDYVKQSLLEGLSIDKTVDPLSVSAVVKKEVEINNDSETSKEKSQLKGCCERCKDCEKVRRKKRVISARRRHSSFISRRLRNQRQSRHKSEERRLVNVAIPPELVSELTSDCLLHASKEAETCDEDTIRPEVIQRDQPESVCDKTDLDTTSAAEYECSVEHNESQDEDKPLEDQSIEGKNFS